MHVHLRSSIKVFGSLQYKKTYMKYGTASKNTYDQHIRTV